MSEKIAEEQRCAVTGKICYSKKEAGNVMHYLKRKRNLPHRGQNIPQRLYYCNDCGAYHLTHFKKRKRRTR